MGGKSTRQLRRGWNEKSSDGPGAPGPSLVVVSFILKRNLVHLLQMEVALGLTALTLPPTPWHTDDLPVASMAGYNNDIAL